MDFTLTNPIPPPDEKQVTQFDLDFDFNEAHPPEARESQRECKTCWKYQECELRIAGATGCGKLF